MDSAKNELEKLAVKWTWKDASLKLAGIGTPLLLIKSIMEKKSYEPFVPKGTIRRNKAKVTCFDELLADANNNFDDIILFDAENQQVLELAGFSGSHFVRAKK